MFFGGCVYVGDRERNKDIYVYVYIYIHIYIYIYIYIFAFVHLYTYLYTCIITHEATHPEPGSHYDHPMTSTLPRLLSSSASIAI